MSIPSIQISERVFRIAYGTSVESLPDWMRVGHERFDDPLRTYRVLYTATTEVGAFIERFARFRPNNKMAAFEEGFDLSDPMDDVATENLPSGTVIFSEYAPLFVAELLPTDREALVANLCVDAAARHFGPLLDPPHPTITVGEIVGDDRKTYRLSQQISRLSWGDPLNVAGLHSFSTVCPEHTNVSIFESEESAGALRTPLSPKRRESVSADNAALQEAASYLGIYFQSPSDYFAHQISLGGF